MKILGLILARGGSKGIPRKNLQEIGGKSLIRRCAETACGSALTRVVVYSDSQEILAEARAGGADAFEREPLFSRDDTTSEQTVIRFLDEHADVARNWPIMMLQCTTPFVTSRDITLAVHAMKSNRNLDSMISATHYERFLGYTWVTGTFYGCWIPVYPYRWLRQQCQSAFFQENGALYCTQQSIWRSGRRMGCACGMVVMPHWRSIEIDEPIDLEVARAIAPIVQKEEYHGKAEVYTCPEICKGRKKRQDSAVKDHVSCASESSEEGHEIQEVIS